MDAPVPDELAAGRRAIALLPAAYLLHLLEEWFGGFSAWTLAAFGNEVTPDRFLLVNVTTLALFIIGTMAALRSPRLVWIGTSFATLIGLNGILHTLASVGFGFYSPGTVSGLLIYIPLSVFVLRWSASAVSRPVFVRSVLSGVGLHGVAALIAYI